jgi:hypothetical protein
MIDPVSSMELALNGRNGAESRMAALESPMLEADLVVETVNNRSRFNASC